MKGNKIFMAAAAGLLAAACTPNLDNFMAEDGIAFSSSNLVKEVSILDGSASVAIIKSGKGRSAADIKIGMCTQEEFDKLNVSDNGYVAASEGSFALDKQTVHISEDETRAIVNVSWDPMAFLSMAGDDKVVIPLKIYDSNLELDSTRTNIFIYPRVSSVSMSVEEIKGVYPEEKDPSRFEKAYGTVLIDKALTKQDLVISLDVDESLISKFSEERGVNYKKVPAGFFELLDKQVTIPAGKQSASFAYTVDHSVFFDNSGILTFDECDMIVPITIKSVDVNGIRISKANTSVVTVAITSEVRPVTGRDPEIIMGPWEVLEGEELSMDGDPDIESNWYRGKYTTAHLCDGNFGSSQGNLSDDPSQWGWFCTRFWSENNFPLEFVFDVGEEHIYSEFRKVDAGSHQGQFQDFEVYVARSYTGATTEWKLAAKGSTVGFPGWQAWSVDNIANFTYTIPGDKDAEGSEFHYTRGRYIKFVIVKPFFPMDDPDYLFGHGYLSEFYALGW